MTLSEACEAARQGNFVSNKYFDRKQSMHHYKGNLYYEDGANLTVGSGLKHLKTEDWAKTDWYIKYTKDKVDIEKLKVMHEKYKCSMLSCTESYEECIIEQD